MARVMVTIASPDEAPTIDGLRRRYHLADDDIDETFGVVEIDPDEHLYTVLVEESAAAAIVGDDVTAHRRAEGPFSNPRIEPFGPPEPDERTC